MTFKKYLSRTFLASAVCFSPCWADSVLSPEKFSIEGCREIFRNPDANPHDIDICHMLTTQRSHSSPIRRLSSPQDRLAVPDEGFDGPDDRSETPSSGYEGDGEESSERGSDYPYSPSRSPSVFSWPTEEEGLSPLPPEDEIDAELLTPTSPPFGLSPLEEEDQLPSRPQHSRIPQPIRPSSYSRDTSVDLSRESSPVRSESAQSTSQASSHGTEFLISRLPHPLAERRRALTVAENRIAADYHAIQQADGEIRRLQDQNREIQSRIDNRNLPQGATERSLQARIAANTQKMEAQQRLMDNNGARINQLRWRVQMLQTQMQDILEGSLGGNLRPSRYAADEFQNQRGEPIRQQALVDMANLALRDAHRALDASQGVENFPIPIDQQMKNQRLAAHLFFLSERDDLEDEDLKEELAQQATALAELHPDVVPNPRPKTDSKHPKHDPKRDPKHDPKSGPKHPPKTKGPVLHEPSGKTPAKRPAAHSSAQQGGGSNLPS